MTLNSFEFSRCLWQQLTECAQNYAILVAAERKILEERKVTARRVSALKRLIELEGLEPPEESVK